jgi:hypothetical protein
MRGRPSTPLPVDWPAALPDPLVAGSVETFMGKKGSTAAASPLPVADPLCLWRCYQVRRLPVWSMFDAGAIARGTYVTP